MKLSKPWVIVLVVIAALGLAACSQEPAHEKEEPAVLEPQGDGRNLVILTDRAAERLDIQTEPVREDQIMMTRTVGGEVAGTDASSGALVLVEVSAEDIAMLAPGMPARVLTLDDPEDSDNGEGGFAAELDELPGLDDVEDNGFASLTFVINEADHGLIEGQRLSVELSLKGSDKPQLVVPHSALIYDIYGETWVYIMTEPLKFLRFPVIVDYIKKGNVVLTEGPPVGTEVVTVGVPELHGTDTGVGK